MDKIEENRGITVLSLVITVIVLLLLIGVSISMIVGDNGIVTKAQEAKQRQEIAGYLERIELARGDVGIENFGVVILDKLIDKIYEEEIIPNGNIVKIDETKAQLVTIEGYIFIITADETEFIKKGEGGIIERPPDLVESNLEFRIEPEGWTNDKVVLIIDVKIEGEYIVEYSVDSKIWNEYQGAIEINQNTTVLVCLKNIVGIRGNYASIKINNIDKLPPTNFTPTVITTTSSINIDAREAIDAQATIANGQSGIQEIWYSKDGGTSWQTNANKTEKSYQYIGLLQNTKYAIQVKIIDNAQNQTITKVQNITTDTIDNGLENVIISAPKWNEKTHKADVTISKNNAIESNLDIQYQINTYKDTDWNIGTTVNNLNLNDIVYARLWDGTNGGNYTSIKIIDDVNPQSATITLSGTNTITTENIIASVRHIDNESGIDITNCRWIYTTSSEIIGTIASSYPNTFTSNGENIILNNTTPGTYYLHVLTQDKAGNKKESISKAIKVNQLVTGITLSKTKTSIEKGFTENLVATITPNNASNKSIIWSSSDSSIATVNNGIITAKGIGTTTIMASTQDGSGKSAICTVTVEKVSLSRVAKVGDYIKYDSGINGIITCRVLYTIDSAYGLQIISNKSVKNITLGGNNWELGKESYNNAIGTLNNEALGYLNTTYAQDARSVGSNPNNKNNETVNTVKLPPKGWAIYTRPNGWASDDTECKDTDTNYQTDWNAMQVANIHSIEENYWLASRNAISNVDFYYFDIRTVDTNNNLTSRGACATNYYGDIGGSMYINGLRPCITLKSNLKIIQGDGKTEQTAYELGI